MATTQRLVHAVTLISVGRESTPSRCAVYLRIELYSVTHSLDRNRKATGRRSIAVNATSSPDAEARTSSVSKVSACVTPNLRSL